MSLFLKIRGPPDYFRLKTALYTTLYYEDIEGMSKPGAKVEGADSYSGNTYIILLIFININILLY